MGLALFFGFAFEEFYGGEQPIHAGGVRTFPLIVFAGTALWLIDPVHGAAFIAGLVVLGAWLYAFIRASTQSPGKGVDGPLIVPVTVLIAYALGPATLVLPLWMPAFLVIGTVLLLGSRSTLHRLVSLVPGRDVLVAGQFLLLVAVVLPILYQAPAIPFTQITPLRVWLAVVAVSTISYASYLLQKYVFPQAGVLLTAALGGLYSSTATTVVLARRASEAGTMNDQTTAGIVAATGMMYVRMVVLIAIFNLPLAGKVLLPFALLAALCAIVAAYFLRRSGNGEAVTVTHENPLQLGTAVIFAVLLVVTSLVSKWVQVHAGAAGVYALAAVIGVTDVDPFVLSLAQGVAQSLGLVTSATAIVIASSSNDVLKALYTLAFARVKGAGVPAAVLAGVAAAGLATTLLVR